MKKIFFILLFLWALQAHSQIYVENMDRMLLTGSLRTEGNLLLPVRWAKVELKGMGKVVHADGTGYFVMDSKDLIITSRSSELVLVVSADGYETTEFVVEAGLMELGVLFVKMNFKDINPITVNDLMPDKPEINNQMISKTGAAALFWNDDPLAKSVNYQLGMHGYKMRGYDWQNTEVYLNGASFNDPETGYAFAGLLNGFIDITQKNSGSSRLVNNKTYYGDLGGYSSIESNPLMIAPRAKVSYTYSNSLYAHSMNAFYATGKLASGWALAFVFSGKLGEGFVEGTKYEGFSYMFSAGKEIDDFQNFSFFIGGAPTRRGGINYSTQEVYNRNNDNFFNSAFGESRIPKNIPKNSKNDIYHQPIIGLSHEWEGEVSSLKTSLLFSTGTRKETGLNRNSEPSVWDGFVDPFNSSQHMPWDSMSSENRKFDGRAKYILDANSSNRTMFSLNSVYDLFEWGALETTGGIEAKIYGGRYYNQVYDLLDGKYWLNVDKFLTTPPNPDYYQFDLIEPNRQVARDGKFDYDYSIKYQSYKLWNVWRYYWGLFKFSLGGSASLVVHGYEGNIKNGKVPDSGSKMPAKKFFNFSGKAGAAYKLSTTSEVEINAMYSHRAPLFANTYLAPRISGELLPNLKNEKIIAGELNYNMSNKLMDLRFSGYFTMMRDRSVVRSYYNDSYASRINMGITGLNSMHAGGELTAKISVNKSVKLNFAAAYGVFKYISDPKILLLQENINEIQLYDTAHFKGLALGNAPQLAISAGGLYQSPMNFWLGLNLSYTGLNFADENPFALAYSSLEKSEPQTKLNGAFTVNFNGGYTYIFGGKKKNALSLNVNVQNLLGNKNGILGAYRPFGLENSDIRYAYMYGRTIYLMLRFWF